LREEATRQRFAQMKRKPWLQARAQIDWSLFALSDWQFLYPQSTKV
jgi:hypothetical protein